MSLEDREKLNRLEELKSKLFSKNFPTRMEHRDHFSPPPQMDVPDSWEKRPSMFESPGKFFMKTSVFKKFFLFSVIFFVLAFGYATYIFLAGGNTVSNNNIDISVLGNSFTAGGEELPLIIGITNKNSSALELVDLVVEYPKSSVGNLSSETERIRESLGIIPAGSVRNENISVILFGEQGSIRPIKISIEYRVEGSNAIFIKEKLFDITINSTPINLSISAPTEANSNQEIVLDIIATLNSTKAVSGVLLNVDYPVGFKFISAKPSASFGDNIWNFGDLAPGAESKVSITGKMIDVFDGEEKTFNITSGLQSRADKAAIDVAFNSLKHTLFIKKPLIEASLFINGVNQREYAVDSKVPIQGEIRWVNNLDTKINDLSIQAKISGNAVNRKSISAYQGFYNSLEDIITWDKNSQNGFREVSPGDAGSVSFSFSSLSLFSALDGVLSQPSINIEISISGKQSLQGYDTKELTNRESQTVKVISDVGLATKALYFSGPFTNSGLIPPKVEKETTYTIVWSLSNTSNNVSKTQVRASLPSWVRFIGPATPASEDLVYNPSTKEIVWNAGNIPRGAGITGSEKTVAFKIGFTPSLSQINTSPTLINNAVLTGHDDFANVDIRVNKSSLNTRLDSDPAFPSDGDRVVE